MILKRTLAKVDVLHDVSNGTFKNTEHWLHLLGGFLRVLFYISVAVLILVKYEPVSLRPHPILLNSLLEGKTSGYTLAGSQLANFKPLLPKSGKFSFLTAHAYKKDTNDTKFYMSVQNYLTPLLLNPLPGETMGILFTENDKIGKQRLKETGYRMVTQISDGKGIIQKIR